MNKKALLVCFVLFNLQLIKAQDDKIKFGAYSRALQQVSTLGSADTLNADHTSKGQVLLDLGININPDKRTEIQAIVRFNSNLSGFYGGGVAATLRQLYVKGLVGKYFNYQVGDLYMKLTPYTFFNSDAEGSANEGTIFQDIRRDYTNYENLSNKGNAWWQQGANTNFAVALEHSIVDTIRVDAFFLRNRTSFAALPSSFHAGGKISVTQSPRFKFAFNYLNLYDVGANSISDSLTISNPVGSAEVDIALYKGNNSQLRFLGEVGFSNNTYRGYKVPSDTGFFYDAGLQLSLKPQRIVVSANLTYVSPEFYSSAAQSKRVNYTLTPSTLFAYGNDPLHIGTRAISIFDLVRDPSVYSPVISRTLMAYNPIYGNALPYGKATPNRQGLQLNAQYKDSLQRIAVDLDAAFLSDIVGENSTELRSFVVLKGGLDLNIHKFFDRKKRLIFTAGYKYESTKRGGDVAQQVDLTNNLLDLGLEVETFKKMSVLLGYKMLSAQGNTFISVRNLYNTMVNFTPMSNIDISQNIVAIGLKYRFSERTYITLQNHSFSYTDNATAAKSYTLNQLLVLFNMNF